jgi:hypothetical protein
MADPIDPPPVNPAPESVPEGEAYIPTEEVPDVVPPKASMYPLSSAPVPEGANLETSTPSIQ